MDWERFKKYLLVGDSFSLDISRMNFDAGFLAAQQPAMRRAFEAMERLEAGALANPDENRMVGHYWLRNPALAPAPQIRQEIESCLSNLRDFARQVHSGAIRPPQAARYTDLLVIGIGGSALGPQFVARALGSPQTDRLQPHFFDNTDPDGMDLVLAHLGAGLKQTLVLVISKSGGTKETRNGMLEAARAFEQADLKFASQAVAITQEGSELDRLAVQQRWLARFPMWDFIGGRTSVLSAVGLLPAALQGLDIQGLLDGARAMDEWTRVKDTLQNPAALLALMWFHAGRGHGAKDMVILPYKDRLELFSRYLQQLVMESLGKERDLDGRVVNQGLAVYGNKGSTDQHAYVQQLREGLNNFFVTFIEVLKDRPGPALEVEPKVTSGDFLEGFYLGTREALTQNGRESITLTVADTGPRTIGGLIALYERAVGLYASLINVNAYHQPGVEAGKKAASAVIALQGRILEFLEEHRGESFSVPQLAQALPGEAELIFKVLQHLAANERGVGCELPPGRAVLEARYGLRR